jgi:hypothetical protein
MVGAFLMALRPIRASAPAIATNTAATIRLAAHAGRTKASATAPAAATKPSAYRAITAAPAIMPAPFARTDTASVISILTSSTCFLTRVRVLSMADVTTAPSGRFGRGSSGPKALAPGVPFEAFCPTPPFPPIGSLTAIPPFALCERSLRSAVIRLTDEGLGPSPSRDTLAR